MTITLSRTHLVIVIMLGVIVVEVIAPGFLLNVRNQLENLFFENVKKNEMKLTVFPAKINYF
jgi:hypothetical protein